MSQSLSRLSINIPADLHKYIRHLAVHYDESVTDLVIEALQHEIERRTKKVPNSETLAVFRKTDKGEDLTTYNSFEDFLSEIGKDEC